MARPKLPLHLSPEQRAELQRLNVQLNQAFSDDPRAVQYVQKQIDSVEELIVMKNRQNSLYLPNRVIVKLMPQTTTSLSK